MVARTAVTVATMLAMVGLAQDAVAATCYEYIANFQAQSSSNFGTTPQPVQTQSLVYWRDTGGRGNQFEFLVRFPGDPNSLSGSVVPTTVEFMTNSMFARNAGMANSFTDLGTVGTVLAQDGVTQLFTFQVITDASYILPPSNWFTAPGPGTPSSGGLGGLCFLPSMQNFCTELGQSAILSVVYLVPRNGSGYFYFPAANVIAGEIILNGSQIDNGNVQGQYHGFFQGNFNQAIPCG